MDHVAQPCQITMRHKRTLKRFPRHTLRKQSADNANERTFLAWIRTALGFVAAGVAVAAVARLNHGLRLEVRLSAVVLVVCGLVCGLTALVQWMRNERAIRLARPLPSSPVLPFLTVAIVVVALVAIVVVGLQ